MALVRSSSWGEDCGMHGLRHYEVRLRRSQRTQYVVARTLLVVAAVVVVLVGLFLLFKSL
jgi:hypothetical protein